MKNFAAARCFGYGTNANSFINPTPSNKSLDASGGSVFRIITGPAMLEWIRAAASTQTLGASAVES